MSDPRRSALLTGVLFGLAANFLWGTAFLVPVLLASFTSVEITLARYLFYGLVSLGIFAVAHRRAAQGHGRAIWRTAMLFAVAGNIGYYLFLVLGVQFVGAPVTAVIIGTLPVTVALYGNWKRREYPFSRLALPIGLILTGLLIVNLTEVSWADGLRGGSLSRQLVGVGCAITALSLWTWFGVTNASFLKAHPQISPAVWSTLIGVSTLVLVVAALPVLALAGGGAVIPRSRFGADTAGALLPLIAGGAVLGVLVSWGGTTLWNRASERLPVSLAGQLIVFETISGLTYVFIAESRKPPPLELLGITALIGGVLLGIHRMEPASAEPSATV